MGITGGSSSAMLSFASPPLPSAMRMTRDHQPCKANVQARITQRASSALVALFRAPGRADGTRQRTHLRPGGTPAATRRQQRRRAVDALRERRRSALNGASAAGTSIVSQAKAAARAGPVAASPRVRAAASNRHCWGPTPLASGESSAHLRPQHAAAPCAWPRAATWDRIEDGILSRIKEHTSLRSF